MNRSLKRALDVAVAVPASIVGLPIVASLVAAATIDTRRFGLYRQHRVGRGGQQITVAKIRSMRPSASTSTITAANDTRITPLGARIRRWKLDELPQFWLVAAGTMSLVGPRPDVAGYADTLTGDDAVVLGLRPGITGPATLAFRSEEDILAAQDDPAGYNDTVIWPAKVAINRAYAHHGSVADDLRVLRWTLRADDDALAAMLQSWDADLLSLPGLAHIGDGAR